MSRLTIAASLLLALPSVSTAQQALTYASNDTGLISAAIFETKDAAALTVGLAPLSRAALRKGEREVRIWYSSFGNPQFLVIIKQSGAATTGRLLLWWDQYYESNSVERGYARRQLRSRRLRLRPDLQARFAVR